VVWAALRGRGEARPVEVRRPEALEPRIVVVPAPSAPPAYAPTAAAGYYPPAEAALPFQPALRPQAGRRQFTVIGGAGEEENGW
jgi:hypothetical protein